MREERQLPKDKHPENANSGRMPCIREITPDPVDHCGRTGRASNGEVDDKVQRADV